MSKSSVTREEGDISLHDIDQMFKDAGAMDITIGFQGSSALETHSEGATIVDIATWNHMGTDNIPARPFLRTAMTENEDKIRKVMIAEGKRLFGKRGGSVRKMFARIALFAVELVRERIRSTREWAVPLAASTVAARLKKVPGERSGAKAGAPEPRTDSDLKRESAKRRAVQTIKRGTHEKVTPLIDTGQLVQGVTYAIRRLGAVIETGK